MSLAATSYVEADTAGTPGRGARTRDLRPAHPRGATRLQLRRRRVREVDRQRRVACQRTHSGAVGECNDHGAALDLDGDVALVRNSPTDIREYRRNGTALQWVQVGTITPPAGAATRSVRLRSRATSRSYRRAILRARGLELDVSGAGSSLSIAPPVQFLGRPTTAAACCSATSVGNTFTMTGFRTCICATAQAASITSRC